MKNRHRLILALLCLAATAIAIGWMVYISFDPSGYFSRDPDNPPEWEHPTDSVIYLSLVMLVEALVFSAILLSPKPKQMWSRGVISSLILLPWTYHMTRFFFHMPMFFLWHHAWLLLLSVLAISTTVISAFIAIVIRLQAESNAR